MKTEWKQVPFEEAIEHVTYTNKIQRKDFLEEGEFPIVSQEESFLNGYWDKAADLFKVERPVVLFGDHTRVLKYIDFDFVLGADGVKILKPKPFLLPKFFYYQLLSADIRQLGYARHYRLLKELKVAYPILPEQQRIVTILDEAFDGIAAATANAEKNLQNAQEVFESHLQSIFNSRGSGWERVQLETLLERGWIESHLDGNHGGDYPRKEEFITQGVPYISANCLDGDRLDMSRAKYLSHERAALLRKGIAKNNDVLFAHNATVGPVSILQTVEPKVILGTSLTYYRCNSDHILPMYLAHYMRSFGFKSQYTSIMRQSTRNQVPITKQREFYHVIPPVNEQRVIIDQLDGIMETSQRLENILQQKLTALDELKQSLLHRAFNGNL